MGKDNQAVVAVINYCDRIFLQKSSNGWNIPLEMKVNGDTELDALQRHIDREIGLSHIIMGKNIGETQFDEGKKASWYECFSATDKNTKKNEGDGIWAKRREVLSYIQSEDLPQGIVEYFTRDVKEKD